LVRTDGKDLLPQHVEGIYDFLRKNIFSPLYAGSAFSSTAGAAEFADATRSLLSNLVNQWVNKEKFVAHWEDLKMEKGWEVPSPYEM